MRATDGTSRTLFFRASKGSSSLVVASSIFVSAIGLFLFARRVTGSLGVPLPATQLVVTAAALCGWAVVVRDHAAKKSLIRWLPLGAVALFAIGCSYPANRVVDWLVWLPLIGLVIRSPVSKKVNNPLSINHSCSDVPRAKDESFTSTAAVPIANGQQVLQQLTRVRLANGKNAVHGTVVAEFAAGQRLASVYVGFCPPFESLPHVNANLPDGFEADLKWTQVLHHGAQIDVRLSEPAEDAVAISIRFSAVEG
jgi:hypothetical protein